MRVISLLLVLVIIAYFISVQLSTQSSTIDVDAIIENQDMILPKVPSTPEDLKRFDADVNKFIKDAAADRNKELEKIEQSLSN